LKIAVLVSVFFLFLLGCSASTGSRYETKEEKKTETTPTTTEEKKDINEDFDITPYQTEIELEAVPIMTDKLPGDVWYGYADTTTALERKILGTTDGYRVQVLSTDDIDEANEVRTELYEKTARKEVYVIFEPPFYKVKVGDFTSKNDANDFKFKLNQLGYTEAKVVQETINLFE
jgi:hypothetical protein